MGGDSRSFRDTGRPLPRSVLAVFRDISVNKSGSHGARSGFVNHFRLPLLQFGKDRMANEGRRQARPVRAAGP